MTRQYRAILANPILSKFGYQTLAHLLPHVVQMMFVVVVVVHLRYLLRFQTSKEALH